VFVDRDAAKARSLDEVIERWLKLFKGSVLVDRYWSGRILSRAEWDALGQLVSKWRERLSDISWFHALSQRIRGAQGQSERLVFRSILGGMLQLPGLAG
jgi:hypothetical protein